MLNNEDIQHICEVFDGAGLTEDKVYKKLLIAQKMDQAQKDYHELINACQQDLKALDKTEENK